MDRRQARAASSALCGGRAARSISGRTRGSRSGASLHCTGSPLARADGFPMQRAVASLIVAALGVACTSTPTAPTTWSTGRLREQLLISNLNNTIFGSPGRITRWRVPIQVNTNGIARADTALRHYEEWTGGIVRFTRVSQAPAQGLTFIEGGAGGPESTESCGSLGDVTPVAGQPTVVFQWDASRAITGAYTIHLGADECDDETAGPYPSSVAEHQL